MATCHLLLASPSHMLTKLFFQSLLGYLGKGTHSVTVGCFLLSIVLDSIHEDSLIWDTICYCMTD